MASVLFLSKSVITAASMPHCDVKVVFVDRQTGEKTQHQAKKIHSRTKRIKAYTTENLRRNLLQDYEVSGL